MKTRGQAGNRSEVERMLHNSQTKVIAPIITLGLLREYLSSGKTEFTDTEIRRAYTAAVLEMKRILGHDVHIGAKYYDAYGSRMSRYGVLEQTAHLTYRLASPYIHEAENLASWIPERIQEHITDRIGIVPGLKDASVRAELAESAQVFLGTLAAQIGKNPTNFEIFTFAVMKVHLEKFACKLYRDTRTSSRDNGVDISTNFGVVYQIKKLRIQTEAQVAQVYAELRGNFDTERLRDGNVILVIDEITREHRQYLIDMKVQSISKDEVLKLAMNLEDPEDRQKVLRVVFEEFAREYSSRIT